MLENKAVADDLEIQRQNNLRERMSEVREKVNRRRNEKDVHALKLMEFQQKTMRHAGEIRHENEMLKKKIAKKDKTYLRRAQEKRFEQ